ncbi:MAG: hypothetical protein Q8900_11545 [Bacillota bacterium]|nr:hypothetical protein [Bacillota bacterium]
MSKKDKKDKNECDENELEISTELSISVSKPGCPEAELNFDISKEIFVVALALSIIQKGLEENDQC